MDIELRSLGKTEMMVTPIGLGCWQFSKQKNFTGKFWPNLNDETIKNIVSIALDSGINWFDTAEAYGNGASEKALSFALQKAGKKPGEVHIATKWLPVFRFASNILKTINNRISALAPFPIDLYQIHNPMGFSSVKSEINAMTELVSRNLIKHIGVSNFSAKQMEIACEELEKNGIHLASNQVMYNLLNRKIETNGVLDVAKKLGISIIAYSPLAKGIVTGKFHDSPELIKNIGFRKYYPQFKPEGLKKSFPVVALVKELSEKYQATPSQIALNWVINYHGDMVVAIPGATKESHIKQNVGAMCFRLSAEDMKKLNEVSEVFK